MSTRRPRGPQPAGDTAPAAPDRAPAFGLSAEAQPKVGTLDGDDALLALARALARADARATEKTDETD